MDKSKPWHSDRLRHSQQNCWLVDMYIGQWLIFAYASSGNFSRLSIDLMAILVLSIFVFSGVVWWIVGRIVRKVFEIVRARRSPAK